ncbi:hypothetical protein [Bacillus cereus]|uniref:hypothetical protein n=1 Tax=Bacillus cereus TaxID=1396 RepID=UPI00027AC2EE|nr:hypothetical protein [Bacillus cereus]EJS76144.1 hypothetical protein ICY_02480 [Bacillus cereus BAG2X1-3]
MLRTFEATQKLFDDTEIYPFVNEVDTLLRLIEFSSVNWRQTAPCHWALVAYK